MNVELMTAAISGLPPSPKTTESRRDLAPLPATPTGEPIPAQTREDLAAAARPLKEAVEQLGIELKFSRDDSTNTIVVEMVDQKTGETLRQIPNELMLHLSATLGQLQGYLFNRRA